MRREKGEGRNKAGRELITVRMEGIEEYVIEERLEKVKSIGITFDEFDNAAKLWVLGSNCAAQHCYLML